MDEGERNLRVYQITSGIRFIYMGGERYKITSPSRELMLLAEYVYADIINSLRFEGMMTDEEAGTVLLRMQIWTPHDDDNLEKLEKHLEDKKVDLYESMFHSEKQETIRRQIKHAKSAINKSIAKKHFLDHNTLRHHALLTKKKFLVAMCLIDSDGNHVYNENTFWNSDSTVIEQAISALEKDIISMEEYRELARTEPWRSIWGTGKEKCLGTPSCEWTDEQKILATFSKMYENAQQSLDCPPDEVFEDDDMFDGWMISQRREREREQKKKQVDAFAHISPQAGEVFITAENPEDAKKIYEINSPDARRRIAQRQSFIEKAGKGNRVEEAQLPDIQVDLQLESMQMAKEKLRGRG